MKHLLLAILLLVFGCSSESTSKSEGSETTPSTDVQESAEKDGGISNTISSTLAEAQKQVQALTESGGALKDGASEEMEKLFTFETKLLNSTKLLPQPI